MDVVRDVVVLLVFTFCQRYHAYLFPTWDCLRSVTLELNFLQCKSSERIQNSSEWHRICLLFLEALHTKMLQNCCPKNFYHRTITFLSCVFIHLNSIFLPAHGVQLIQKVHRNVPCTWKWYFQIWDICSKCLGHSNCKTLLILNYITSAILVLATALIWNTRWNTLPIWLYHTCFRSFIWTFFMFSNLYQLDIHSESCVS